MQQPATLRKSLQLRRKSLDPKTRKAANHKANKRLIRNPAFKNAKRIAGFISVKGEIDPCIAMSEAIRLGKKCYLPVLHPFLSGRLIFVEWTPHSPMRLNRFGIPEPLLTRKNTIKPIALDCIITPLTGFDPNANRMGMGGGFYDRSFAFLRRRKRWKKPTLLGFAFEIQKVSALPINPWDIQLAQVVTESASYPPRANSL